MEQLKRRAKELDLWNLFLPRDLGGKWTAVEYAAMCEHLGRSPKIAPEVSSNLCKSNILRRAIATRLIRETWNY